MCAHAKLYPTSQAPVAQDVEDRHAAGDRGGQRAPRGAVDGEPGAPVAERRRCRRLPSVARADDKRQRPGRRAPEVGAEVPGVLLGGRGAEGPGPGAGEAPEGVARSAQLPQRRLRAHSAGVRQVPLGAQAGLQHALVGRAGRLAAEHDGADVGRLARPQEASHLLGVQRPFQDDDERRARSQGPLLQLALGPVVVARRARGTVGLQQRLRYDAGQEARPARQARHGQLLVRRRLQEGLDSRQREDLRVRRVARLQDGRVQADGAELPLQPAATPGPVRLNALLGPRRHLPRAGGTGISGGCGGPPSSDRAGDAQRSARQPRTSSTQGGQAAGAGACAGTQAGDERRSAEPGGQVAGA